MAKNEDMYPAYSSDSDDNDDETLYKCPKHLPLPGFLNSNWKWNYEVLYAEDFTRYKQLIDRFTRVRLPVDQKKLILIKLTQDIVDAHRFHSPYWDILYKSKTFNN